MAGEFDFIHWVRAQTPARASVPIPPGDDLAAVRWDASDLMLIGVDQVLDGRHFDAAAIFDCPIIGGDTASWDGPLAITVTIVGRSAGIPPVTRRGAKPSDGLYVTGPLGGSIAGRHLTFTPRVALARELASRFRITSMIDLSDGLSRDLGHLCDGSGCGAIVDAAAVPVHEDVGRSAPSGRPPVAQALHDGEDYELLFTSPDPISPTLATRVGEMTGDLAVLLTTSGVASPLIPMGWEHAIPAQ